PHFSFLCSSAPRDLLSFPTRRSSDLHRICSARFFAQLRRGSIFATARQRVGCGRPRSDTFCNRGLARESLGIRPDNSRWRREARSEEHTSELQSLAYLVCRLLLEKKK